MNSPVVVITGALTGIGGATALAFADSGAHLVISGRREAEGKALEVAASGVRVNAGAPGPTETGMLARFTRAAERKRALVSTVPLGRIGQPDDIAGAILFLASDAASFVTGHIVSVDGGKTAG